VGSPFLFERLVHPAKNYRIKGSTAIVDPASDEAPALFAV